MEVPPPPSPGTSGVSGSDVSPADVGELAQIAAEIRAAAPPAPAPGPAGAAADELADELVGVAERVAEGDGKLIEALTADEWSDLFELLFGLTADFRGAHWELTPRAAARLGKWVKRSVDRHGWEWVAKWMPDVMALGLLSYEIAKRVRTDRELAAAAGPKPVEEPAT